MSRLVYKHGPHAGQEFLGQSSTEFNIYATFAEMQSPGMKQVFEQASLFKKAVLEKWDFYQKNYGYKKTKASAKAASGNISKDLLERFPAKVNGIRLNDADSVYELINPLEIHWPKLPWWLNWKLIAAGAVAVYFGPGIIGRYRRGRGK